MEVILQGTGTSSALPLISCVTQYNVPCNTCWSSSLPQGRQNNRRNTGAYLRRIGEDSVVVIDVGKGFLASALEWFPKYKLRKIAAVVLTHAHADGWTLRGILQDHIDVHLSRATYEEVKRAFPYLIAKEFATGGGDVGVSADSNSFVASSSHCPVNFILRSFFLIGGASTPPDLKNPQRILKVPEFKYHIFEEAVPFTIDGLYSLVPLAVHHGRFFSTPAPATPPTLTNESPSSVVADKGAAGAPPMQLGIHLAPEPDSSPYIAYGFLIQLLSSPLSSPLRVASTAGGRSIPAAETTGIGPLSNVIENPGQEVLCTSAATPSIVYISDVSFIPETFPTPRNKRLHSGPQLAQPSCLSNFLSTDHIPKSKDATFRPSATLLILDCLRTSPHSSHFGLLQTLLTAHRIRPRRTYLVGFGHELTHAEWTLIGEILQRFSAPSKPVNDSKGAIVKTLEEMSFDESWEAPGGGVRKRMIEPAMKVLGKYLRHVERYANVGEGLFVRPAYDGMRVVVQDSDVSDG
ncbi:uncharacterized protein EI90DRAFT_3015136 [Cantharellus anzutake]|uniref:uncharacterized protein n=1 Tax=Cantharellus anzutake TaxID=1750568 RepID=UPI001907622E|nr:uncharacterized protein EI90DRAFT_3015136 [Cantharellus anzutake]KAF8334087.1 hypothetical protein EI90DRAFT_3015136 [Cantharellus anzutake]